MSSVFDKPSFWQRARPVCTGFDGLLVLAVVLLATTGLVTMYSAGFDHGTRFVDHARNLAARRSASCSWWRRCRRSS